MPLKVTLHYFYIFVALDFNICSTFNYSTFEKKIRTASEKSIGYGTINA